MWKKMAQIHFSGFVYDHESNTLRIEDDSAKIYKLVYILLFFKCIFDDVNNQMFSEIFSKFMKQP